MAEDEPYCVVIPSAVQALVEGLSGKSAGYADKLRRLGQDPCADDLGAYRLSGPLGPKVCGLHLRNGYRLAFTIQPPSSGDPRERIVVLYVGKREPRHRDADVWTLLHDLFGVENPPEGHHKPPCCEEGQPALDDAEVDAFLRSLAAALRHASRVRTASRGGRARRGRRGPR